MPEWRPADESEALGAEAVLLEWLAAVDGRLLNGPDALRAWARTDRRAFRAAFARFASLPPDRPDLLDAAAAWLLGGEVRPDLPVAWLGVSGDPALLALAAIGGRCDLASPRRFAALPDWPEPARRPDASQA